MGQGSSDRKFENDVKTYGTQTYLKTDMSSILFENDVKTYGTQTIFLDCTAHSKFENDVKTYGTQTQSCGTIPSL